MQLKDVVVYDIEIAKCIPDRNGRELGLEYCAGWTDYANMGIAVLCAYDFAQGEYRVFLEDNLDEFATLIAGRVLAGFNNDGFDNKLLAANGVTVGTSFDLLCELRAAVGEPRMFTPGITRGGRKLDDIARVNLGTQKSGHGSLAPVQWQRGQRGAVIDYCLHDVALTVRLLEKLPILVDPVLMRPVTLAVPWLQQAGGAGA